MAMAMDDARCLLALCYRVSHSYLVSRIMSLSYFAYVAGAGAATATATHSPPHIPTHAHNTTNPHFSYAHSAAPCRVAHCQRCSTQPMTMTER
jgi:hypothetical protein